MMEDPIKVASYETEAQMQQFDQNDRCNVLYTAWDRLRYRGTVLDHHLYSCRNDSSVPDARFRELLSELWGEDKVLVEYGEAFVFTDDDEETLRSQSQNALEAALELL